MTATLTRAELLAVWEQARDQGQVERAITLLSATHAATTRAELLSIPLGERDKRLLGLRSELFGPSMRSVAACPSCNTQLEFTLDTKQLMTTSGDPPRTHLRLAHAGIALELREVTSGDLGALRSVSDVASARRMLCERCIVNATRDGTPVSPASIPERALDEISIALAAADPHAELLIDMHCEPCANRWQLLLDVVSFVWTEIDSLARRLLSEVHVLAWAYGWREADILAMSDARRRHYLAMVS